MIQEKQNHQRLFSIIIGKKKQIPVLLPTHIPSTSFGEITPLHHTIYMQPNWKEMAAALSVMEATAGVVEAVVVEHVVEMGAGVVEAVVKVHHFSMEMVPLIVGISL